MPLLKLVGQGAVITLHLETPIHLDVTKEYRLALCGFYSDNNIPNLPKNANVYFWLDPTLGRGHGSVRTLTLEQGQYNLESLQTLCRRFIDSLGVVGIDSSQFIISKAKNDTAVSIVSPMKFALDSTMRRLLGFGRPKTATTTEQDMDDNDDHDDEKDERNYFEAGETTVGPKAPNLRAVDTIEIQCNLVENSYSNHDLHAHKHQEHRILYTFFPAVPRGYKISELPRERYYAPIDGQLRVIQEITVSIVDQDNRPIVNPSANNIVYLDLKEIK